MFERRLKIILSVLVLLSVALMVRAVMIQVVRHDYWTQRAAGLLETRESTETTRGRILDCNGAVLAVDQPCTDAAVDYRAIISPADPDWVDDISVDRLKDRMGVDVWKHTPRAQRKLLIAAEGANVRADIEKMWDTLALYAAPTDDRSANDPKSAIAVLRAGIIQKVEMQRRWLWFTNYTKNEKNAAEAPRWQRWLAGGSNGDGPDIDQFVVEVDDQKKPHVILPAVNQVVANALGKHLDRLPGLVLQPSIRRQYPMQSTACHLLGRMSRVDQVVVNESKKSDPPNRQYLPNDEIGRGGVEALCEPLLRGSRGSIERRAGTADILDATSYEPGQDVRVTIDAGLQADVQDLFKSFNVNFKRMDPQTHTLSEQSIGLHEMHGAAVVIDVPTGNVLALASNPGFNLDQLDNQYHDLNDDRLDAPLRNRATSDQLEPGSTVKPMIGLAAITQGVLKPLEGIECTGDLYLRVLDDDGKPTDKKSKQVGGRCWVASEFGDLLKSEGLLPIHHAIPGSEHKGHDGNPDGFLTFRDALERSCNIYFETTADRLKPEGIAHWYEQFGFGKKTGIGIFEETGRRPDQFKGMMEMGRMTNCFAGIGQSHVWATPLQIANEAATIARGGVWMRPRLLSTKQQAILDKASPRAGDAPLDKVDLHLDPAGLEQAKLGMYNVVYAPAGTGRQLMFPDTDSQGGKSGEPDPLLKGIVVAGKTGTAQASPLKQFVPDAHGRPTLDPATGKPLRQPLEPSTAEGGESKIAPWYWSSNDKGDTFVHAWFMGYAPIDKPEVAFAVLVEYSPTGGGSASGSIARRLLERCVAHDHLHPAPTMTASQ